MNKTSWNLNGRSELPWSVGSKSFDRLFCTHLVCICPCLYFSKLVASPFPLIIFIRKGEIDASKYETELISWALRGWFSVWVWVWCIQFFTFSAQPNLYALTSSHRNSSRYQVFLRSMMRTMNSINMKRAVGTRWSFSHVIWACAYRIPGRWRPQPLIELTLYLVAICGAKEERCEIW